jgi:hypothetical protein
VVTDTDDGGAWWLAGDGQWHEGAPPAGWVQAGDRRWYPDDPPETAQGYASKFESAGGRTATVLALAGRSEVASVDRDSGGADEPAWLPAGPAHAADTYDDDYDYYDEADGDAAGDVGDELRRRPAWVLVAVLVGLLVAVVGVVGVVTRMDDGTDGETGPTVDTTPPTSATPRSTTTITTSMPATTIDAGPLGPNVTVAPSVTAPSTTVPPPDTTPSTTIPPDTTAEPPATTPSPGPPGQTSIREGGRCFDVGRTAVATNGTPVTCSTTACDGVRFDDPQWRRTTC